MQVTDTDDEPWPSRGRCGPGASQGASASWALRRGPARSGGWPACFILPSQSDGDDGTPVPAPGLRCSATVLPGLRRLRQAGTRILQRSHAVLRLSPRLRWRSAPARALRPPPAGGSRHQPGCRSRGSAGALRQAASKPVPTAGGPRAGGQHPACRTRIAWDGSPGWSGTRQTRDALALSLCPGTSI